METKRCDWCDGTLYRTQHPYKGKDCKRTYCSIDCLSRGEDRALRYIAALAGTVNSHWMLAVVGILALFMWTYAFTPKARAHDPQTHQPDPLDQAKSEAYGICCTGSDYLRVSLWERTETGFRVYVRGKWYEATPRVKVNNMENPDGEAKVWLNGPPEALYIRCFMPGTLI